MVCLADTTWVLCSLFMSLRLWRVEDGLHIFEWEIKGEINVFAHKWYEPVWWPDAHYSCGTIIIAKQPTTKVRESERLTHTHTHTLYPFFFFFLSPAESLLLVVRALRTRCKEVLKATSCSPALPYHYYYYLLFGAVWLLLLLLLLFSPSQFPHKDLFSSHTDEMIII